jgi:hypothetical protein
VPETDVRLILVDAGLPEPVVGYQVRHEGRYVGTPDLAYVDERIALEYEGDGHRTSRTVFRQDIERKERFHDVEWRTIRITGAHLEEPETLVRRVAHALASRRVGP